MAQRCLCWLARVSSGWRSSGVDDPRRERDEPCPEVSSGRESSSADVLPPALPRLILGVRRPSLLAMFFVIRVPVSRPALFLVLSWLGRWVSRWLLSAYFWSWLFRRRFREPPAPCR